MHEEAIAAYAAELAPEAARLGVELGRPRFDDDDYAAKLAIVLEASLEVVSFTFGCPSTDDVARLQAAGAEVWVTVTSAAEAIDAAACGRRRARRAGRRGRRPSRRLARRRDRPAAARAAGRRARTHATRRSSRPAASATQPGCSRRSMQVRQPSRPARRFSSVPRPARATRIERCSRVPASRRSPAPSRAVGRAGSSTSSCASIRTLRRRTRTSTT